MKRGLIFLVTGLIGILMTYTYAAEKRMTKQIRVKVNEATVVFALNDSRAARDLLAQLPLEATVEDFGGNEKIFYPPDKLKTADTPRADAKAGTLAYYAPWGNVVMFYKDFGSAPGLYALGQAVSGADFIEGLAGTIRIETVTGSENNR